MLAELPERDASGEIRIIYGEIRRLWAVPYVSSMQRHLATRPGFNLVLSGLLRRLLDGQRPEGQARDDAAWSPPPPLPTLPSLVDVADLDPAARGVLMSLSTTVGSQPFVPGLYRLLARWPAFLAQIATVLGPCAADPAVRTACRRVEESIAAEVPAIFARLPRLPAAPPMPPRGEWSGVLAALETYRRTSPEGQGGGAARRRRVGQRRGRVSPPPGLSADEIIAPRASASAPSTPARSPSAGATR